MKDRLIVTVEGGDVTLTYADVQRMMDELVKTDYALDLSGKRDGIIEWGECYWVMKDGTSVLYPKWAVERMILYEDISKNLGGTWLAKHISRVAGAILPRRRRVSKRRLRDFFGLSTDNLSE